VKGMCWSRRQHRSSTSRWRETERRWRRIFKFSRSRATYVSPYSGVLHSWKTPGI